MVSGILFVDKPTGPTSHTVVAQTRRALNTRKVGHAGTLDPMATGLLTLGVGTSTRLLTYLVGLGKQYTATIRLGVATHTDDAEGTVTFTADPTVLHDVTEHALHAQIAGLTGTISQRPSSVSAIKVDGKRAHERVREGEDVVLASRTVTVDRFDVRDIRRSTGAIDLDVVVDCSSGTYIRALARDLGEALGVGGHLIALRRTRVGPFSVNSAVVPDDISDAVLIPASVVAAELFPTFRADADMARDIVHGKKVRIDLPNTPLIAVTNSDDVLIALLSVSNGVGRVEIGFPHD